MTGEGVTTTPRLQRALRWAALCGLALVLFAGQVLALGLGRIEVKSRAGEPLLAEIQVVSSDPAELDQLRARLASPETFRRIGLAAPDAVVSGLEFAVALDARGNPVIRVTTREPVTQPALTFLVEVDWGQGRLVREYSALVDAPQTVSAPAQPAIEAPVAVPSNAIVRTPTAADADPAPADEVREETAAADPAPTPAPQAGAAEAAPQRATATPATAAPAAASTPGEYGPVRAGETLGAIADGLAGDGVSREQAIVALFRANPQAFIAGNLNLMRQGAVLRIPDRGEIAALDPRESRALMREQIAAWRDMTRPAPQPDAAQPGADEATAAAPVARQEEPAAATPAQRTADARLEIVPPSAGDGQQAGIRSGIQAGGEGEMLRQELQQELQQRQETLAARDAEVAELRARVADLERLQAQQAQLLTMKDSELAAVQERLGTPPETAVATGPEGSAAAGLPWVWIGLGLLLVAAAAWLLVRRAPKASPRPRFDTATLAAASPPRGGGADAPAPPVAPPPAPVGVPAWHADSAVPATPSDAVPAARDPGAAADDAAAIAALDPAPGGSERIELARAYLDLGDTDTARDLLREVAEAGDPAARAEASRLLEGIA
ncbi:FimV/HubP family polar landmark protein [Luteimonas sp. MC1750]|uniref:FimV/HubP family polar landmark protein n=1 Tax=Luteimonas sp. MC1750 TaxID=2799326 RepID=UPI0018F0C033|nr:FimV/HubP family polar landmark protein [Luteimonas sp. MC1750]MBJ6984464.1 hypothetical protein [Luteimonas sp. MC1750]QQO04922.1 hypothetical protein JGR68_08485 [Luteimonas sp. MC1750]